jgi:transglutaminase-like putative cysteine protease
MATQESGYHDIVSASESVGEQLASPDTFRIRTTATLWRTNLFAAIASLVVAGAILYFGYEGLPKTADRAALPALSAWAIGLELIALAGYGFSALSAAPYQIPPRHRRIAEHSGDGAAIAAFMLIAVITVRAVRSPLDSLALSIFAAAALRTFTCWTPNRSFVNTWLQGAPLVLYVLVGGGNPILTLILGASWAALAMLQVAMAHSREITQKVLRPKTISEADSDTLWRPTVARSSWLAVLSLLALLSVLVLLTSLLRLPLRQGTGVGVPATAPYEGSSPGTGQRDASGSAAGNLPGAGEQLSDDPQSLDLHSFVPRGEPRIFAVVKTDAPRLMRIKDLPVYDGHSMIASDDSVSLLGKCPCKIPAETSEPAGNRSRKEQLVEFVDDYEGPLPAVYAPETIEFVALKLSESAPAGSQGSREKTARDSRDAGDANVTALLEASDDLSLKTDRPLGKGSSYRLFSTVTVAEESKLAEQDGPTPPTVAIRYLQLPPQLPKRLHDLANEVGGEGTPYSRAMRIARFVASRYREPEPGTIEIPRERDAVDYYIFDAEFRGSYDLATSAAVVMMRANGIPARLVFGHRPLPLDTGESGLGGMGTPAPSSPKNAASAGTSGSGNGRRAPGSPSAAGPSGPANTEGASGPADTEGAFGPESAEHVYALDASLRTSWVELYVPNEGWVTLDIAALKGMPEVGRAAHGTQLLVKLLLAILGVLVLAALIWLLLHRFAKRPKEGDEAGTLMKQLEKATGIPRQPTQTPLEYRARLWSALTPQEREAAAFVIDTIIRMSYTKEHPLPDENRLVRACLDTLDKGRRTRDQARRGGKGARSRRRQSARAA